MMDVLWQKMLLWRIFEKNNDFIDLSGCAFRGSSRNGTEELRSRNRFLALGFGLCSKKSSDT